MIFSLPGTRRTTPGSLLDLTAAHPYAPQCTVCVSDEKTAVILTSSANPSSVGQPVTFTAKVTPEFSGTALGTVTFYDALAPKIFPPFTNVTNPPYAGLLA
jgi:hypothetical protein